MPGIKKDDLIRRLHILNELRAHEGWKLFQAALLPAEQACMTKALTSENAHSMAMAIGGAKVAKDFSTWLDRELAMVELHLQQVDRNTP